MSKKETRTENEDATRMVRPLKDVSGDGKRGKDCSLEDGAGQH